MREAGYDPDHPLKFTLSYNTLEDHKRIAVAVQSMWNKSASRPNCSTPKATVHYANLETGDFDVGREGWIADYDDAQNYLYLGEKRTGPIERRRVRRSALQRVDARGRTGIRPGNARPDEAGRGDCDGRATIHPDLLLRSETIGLAENQGLDRQYLGSSSYCWFDIADRFRYPGGGFPGLSRPKARRSTTQTRGETMLSHAIRRSCLSRYRRFSSSSRRPFS